MLGNNNLVIISCSIFRDALEFLIKNKNLEGKIIFYDSNLHIYPARLKIKLDELILQYESEGKKILIVSGDCHPTMHEYANRPNVARATGVNCCDLLLASEYKRLRHGELPFFLLHEWTIRWKEFFQEHLGMEGEAAQVFMKDMHKKFYYVDLGIEAIPKKELDEINHFFDMPVEIIKVDLKPFTKNLEEGLKKFKEV